LRGRSVALLATACAGAYALPAEAQTQRGREIKVTASTRLQYDSDVVLNDRRIVAGGAGHDDVSASPSLNVDIYLPRATGSVYLRGELGYNFYRKFTRLSREQINLSTGFDQRVLSDCIAHGDVEYSRQLGDIGDLLTTTPIGNAYSNTTENRSVSADIGCGGAIGFRPSVAVSRSETRNSAALRKYSDANTNSVTGQLGYASPAIGVISVFGRYSDSTYVNRPTPNGKDDGVSTYAAGVQLERRVGTRLNFTGSVNYSQVDPRSSAKGFKGLGFDLSGTYRGDVFLVTLTGGRVAEPSTLLFASYDIQTSLGLNLSTEISPRIRWNGGISYRSREYVPSPLFGNIPLLLGTEKVYTLSAGLSYQAGRRLRFLLDGSYTKRDSDLQLYNYDVKRFSLTTILSL
jgi:hypothetical protein